MALFLNIVQGPLAGDKYEIFDGLKIGRTQGHIKLNDNKSSSLHAKIEFDGQKYILKDQGSKNGIRVDGKKVEILILKPGIEFTIGNTSIQVEADAEEEKIETPVAAPPATSLPPIPDATAVMKSPLEPGEVEEITRFEAATSSPEPVQEVPTTIERKTWSEILTGWAEENFEKVKSQKKPVAALEPALNLVFLRGLQAETTWTLGYGPRIAGPRSLDLPIYEPNAPDPCFEILPTATGIRFKSFHAEKVLLNGRSVQSEDLKHGDQITILNSLIEVEFLK